MRPSQIKQKLQASQPILITALQLVDPVVFEMASLLGFDGIWLDMEHHVLSMEKAAELMRAARAGTSDIVVRPAKGEFMRMGRMLEAGAQGIMYPRCDSAEEAAEVVRWAKFAPQGQRGYDSGNADNPYCFVPPVEYIRHANDQTFIIIQLESPEAVERAGEIAAVPGVDALVLGPADFSLLAGIPGQFRHARVDQALDMIAAACQAAGKQWGCPGVDPARAADLMKKGARVFYSGSDMVTVKNGLLQLQREFAPLGFEFRPSSQP